MSDNKPKKGSKKKPGRPPQSGAYSLIVKAGELPKRRTYLRVYLQATRNGLIEDLGPREADLTTAQRVLIDRTVSKLAIIRCIEEYIKETGVFRKAWLSPVLEKSYVAYTNSLRLDLEALGINKRAGERVLSPLEIAAEIDAEKAEAGQASAARPVAASADGPECPGKGAGEGKSGVSRGESEKRRSGKPVEPRSPEGQGLGPGIEDLEEAAAGESS
jgi:hypothetical protein